MEKLNEAAPNEIPTPANQMINQLGKSNIYAQNANQLITNYMFFQICQINDCDKTHLLFSHEYYHLLVTREVNLKNRTFIIPKGRVMSPFGTTKDIAKKFNSLTEENLVLLKSFPGLLIPETKNYYGIPENNEQSILITIDNIDIEKENIIIEWTPIFTLPTYKISNNHQSFDIRFMCDPISELNHTHWAIKNVNLFQAMKDLRIISN